MLIDNPEELRDNIDSYRFELSNTDYLKLKRLSESIQDENNFIEATGNKDMFKATLLRNDMRINPSDKDYIFLYDAWLKEINAQQIAKGNVKLTLAEKQFALNKILMDTVTVDNWSLFGWGDDTNKIYALVDTDRLKDVFVDVSIDGGEPVRVFTSKIDFEVKLLIEKSLRSIGKPTSQVNIAEYWVQLGSPASVAEAEANALEY